MAPLALKVADGSVAGRVVDAKGDLVAGIPLYLSGRDTSQQSRTSDREGRFHFDGVVDEPIELQAKADSEQWTSKRVPAGSKDVLLVLPKPTENAPRMASEELAERFARLRGRKAPPLQAVAWVNAPPRTMEQLRGRGVLIDFWGVGCGPCVASLPGVQRTAEQFAKRGVVVIGLHDSSTTGPDLRKFAKRNRLTYPLAVDAPDDRKASGGKTFRGYGVQSIPSVALIDRNGMVAYLGPSLAEAVGVLGGLVGRAPASG